MASSRLLSEEELRGYCERALIELVQQRGAVIFSEAATILNQDGRWLKDHLPDFPYPRFDLHVVRRARRVLLELGHLEELAATLGGREIKALTYGPWLRDRGRRTEVTAAAARKRRIYRKYLSWTNDPSKCGTVAERMVLASMRSAEGLHGVPAKPGNVREIEGQELEDDKTLDAAAHVVVDLERPSRTATPLVPIGVEVKNVRQPLYPSSTEVWDLLTKLAAFPDVVPVLICRQAHFTLFRMFGDIGATTMYYQRQAFSTAIPEDEFRGVMAELGFSDARRVSDPDRQVPAITGFFSKSLRAPRTEEPVDNRALVVRSQERWAEASKTVSDYADLAVRFDDDEEREAYFAEFRQAIEDAGLRTLGGW